MKQTGVRVLVEEVSEVADRIKRFRLVPTDRERLPSFSGGAHITVDMQTGERRIRNQYSLMSPPSETDHYEISVLREPDSRGGSVFLHDKVAAGDTLWIGQPNNQFAAHDLARKHLFIAGGIGITPFMAMAAQLTGLGSEFELHYGIRSDGAGAYATDLTTAYPGQVTVYRSERGERIPTSALLENQPLGTHLYVCGPERLIEDVLDIARRLGWPEENLHSEMFLSPPAGNPFDVVLERSRQVVHVGELDSILEAVEAADVDAPYLCRGGVCGECETRVLKCDGKLQHFDEYLTAEERARGEQLMICMSRFEGRELVLDL